MSIVWDIESASVSEAELAAIMPQFEAAANLKDPAKIAANLESKRQAWIEDAALDPLTGRVLCIGLLQANRFTVLENQNEAELLKEFWLQHVFPGGKMIGFNTNLFDWPFVVKRGYKYGIRPPEWIRKGRYWSDDFVDLRELWQMGDRQAHGSLDSIARHLGVGQKTGNGKEFGKLWETDRQTALAYLQNDLALTQAIAIRMGVLTGHDDQL